jgi:hypothetical protein
MELNELSSPIHPFLGRRRTIPKLKDLKKKLNPTWERSIQFILLLNPTIQSHTVLNSIQAAKSKNFS